MLRGLTQVWRLSSIVIKLSQLDQGLFNHLYYRCGNRQLIMASSSFKPNRGTGDKGQSSLFTGERRLKSDSIFEVLGCNDELTSYLGLCRVLAHKEGLFDVSETLIKVQCCLQDLNSCVATPVDSGNAKQIERTHFGDELASDLNSLIDIYADKAPPLKSFILPGGTELSAQLHIARTTCRRAERYLVALVQQSSSTNLDSCCRYINRLSDLLFVMARYVCYVAGAEEIPYKKPSNK